ncbi:MAG TPA: hypothetical protein VJG83_01850 [archaeon]|nr:hypothetical protein [archaeon]
MQISSEELVQKARQINDSIYGTERKNKVEIADVIKIHVTEGAKFALEKALGAKGVSLAERSAFVAVLKEQKDAVNILLVGNDQKQKAIDMLKPIFGYKSEEFIDNFQTVFKKIEQEIESDRKKFLSA